MSKPRIGLALGGGGMKGLAHVGALSVLEEVGIQPDFIAGCSIGAVIGAFYASGYRAEHMSYILKSSPPASMFSWRFDGLGLFDVSRFRDFLYEHLGNKRIEQLPIPLALVTTDLETGNECVLDHGPLVPAVLASSAVPGIFPPVEVGGRLLVDGGLVNNLPVSVLKDRKMDHSIAIRLFKKYVWKQLQDIDQLPEKEADRNAQRLVERLQGIMLSGLRERVRERARKHIPLAFYIIKRSLDIVIAHHEEVQLQQAPPDILIEPEVTDIGILDFKEDPDLVMERGIQAARAMQSRLSHLVT